MSTNLILLVDDEPKILYSLTRELLEIDVCEVQTAESGPEALAILNKTPDISVVVSDYHMPGMDGISLLSEVQKINPDITRVMLTGAADLKIAIDAVNRGHIFRFLAKPCPPDVFISTIKAGIRQYRLVIGERELLGKTLNGSIKIMIDILSALIPESFTQSQRLRQLAHDLGIALRIEQMWEVDLAALLSQIGCVTVPREVLERWNLGHPLNEREQHLVQSIPQMGCQLVQNIPRFEAIAQGISCQDLPYHDPIAKGDTPVGDKIPAIGRILKIVTDYDRLFVKTFDPVLAFQQMLNHQDEYDPIMFEVFHTKVLDRKQPGMYKRGLAWDKPVKPPEDELKVNIEGVVPGMVLAKDLVDKHGKLVVAKGTTITTVIRLRLINYYWSQSIIEPIIIERTELDDWDNPKI